jgi:peptide/nickel transport system permease protein
MGRVNTVRDALRTVSRGVMRGAPRWTAAVLIAIAICAVAAPWIAPFDPSSPLDVVALKNSMPSRTHWLGTDPYSRDMLSRALYGARTSISVAAVATLTAVASGTAWAALALHCGARAGAVLMTTTEVVRAVPRLLLLLAVVAIAGTLPPVAMGATVGLTAAPHIARIAHAQLAQLAGRAFTTAASALGVAPTRLLFRHLLPHLIGPLTAAAALLLADIMAFEGAMSFLGLGVRSPAISWGAMVQDALPYLNSAWWVAAVPCSCLLLTVLCTARLADHLDLARQRFHD